MQKLENLYSTNKNGRGRIKYDPDWSETLPYCTYRDGTAGLQFATLDGAILYMNRFGYKFHNQ